MARVEDAELARLTAEIERTLVGPPTSSPTWHTELLRLMALDIENARPPILRAEVAHRLGPYLRFRHFLRHAYAVRLERDALQPLVFGLRATHDDVAQDLRAFVVDVRADLHR